MVNHFFKNNLITTKTGLCSSLKNLVWWNTVAVDTFFPKCFDLTETVGSDLCEEDDFKNEYRYLKAESILKNFVKDQTTIKQFEKLQIAISICEKRIKDIDDQIDDSSLDLMVTDQEWNIIRKEFLNDE